MTPFFKRFSLPRAFLAVVTVFGSLGFFVIVQAAAPLDVAGYLDFSFGTDPGIEVTGEKAESKLWWNSGYWWASLYNDGAGEYHIYRLNAITHNWQDTGVALDDRPGSRADILWDGAANKLYVASHIKVENPGPVTNSGDWGRLYRYSFNSGNLTYSLDSGFPVTVNEDRTETMVLDKDSVGRLWVTYVSRQAGATDYHVYVNASQGSDQSWGTPFTLTQSSEAVNLDDISSLIAFSDNSGPKIGVMWSNQEDDFFHFATHPDAAMPQNGWGVQEIAAVGYPADDHINLAATSSGQVLAAVKLETTTAGEPLIGVIGRERNGSFSFHPITFYSTHETRPGIVINASTNEAYAFATNKSSGGEICYWTADIPDPLSDLAFPQLPCIAGDDNGAPAIIGDSAYNHINNATSTKQNITNVTGFAVLASDDVNDQVYVHNLIFQITPTPSPTSPVTVTPTTTSPTPSSTPPSTPSSTPPSTPSPTLSVTPSPSTTPGSGSLSQVYMPVMHK